MPKRTPEIVAEGALWGGKFVWGGHRNHHESGRQHGHQQYQPKTLYRKPYTYPDSPSSGSIVEVPKTLNPKTLNPKNPKAPKP